jgi:hypothetical protein
MLSCANVLKVCPRQTVTLSTNSADSIQHTSRYLYLMHLLQIVEVCLTDLHTFIFEGVT